MYMTIWDNLKYMFTSSAVDPSKNITYPALTTSEQLKYATYGGGGGNVGFATTPGISWGTLKDIKNPSYIQIIECLQIDGMELKYIEKQNNELCAIAISNNPFALSLVQSQTYELCLLAMRLDIKTFCCIRYPIKEIVELAIGIDPTCWVYINKELFPNEYAEARLKCI